MVKGGTKSVPLKDLRQQCLDLGLRDVGGKKVLEARLKWAAVPEEKLRAIAHDLELLAARPSTPKEELVEVLLSEYHHGTIALPEAEPEAEEETPVEAPEVKPRRSRRNLKKAVEEVPEGAPAPAAEAPEAEAPVAPDAGAQPKEEDVAMEDVAMEEEAKEAEEGPAVAEDAPAVAVEAPQLDVPALEAPPAAQAPALVAELPPAAGDAPTFDFGQAFASSAPAAQTPERSTEVAVAVAPKAPEGGEDLFAGEGEDDPLLDSLAALKLSTPLKERSIGSSNVPALPAPKPSKAPSRATAANKGQLEALRQECAALGVRTDGPRGLLLARKAWAELSSMELRLTTMNLETPLPTERSAMVEQLVVLQQAGKIAPPMSCDENAPAVPKAGIPVKACARGAFARWTELHDPRRMYFLGRAKTDRSSCTRCGQPIELDEWRVGQNAKSCNGFVSWYHASCFATAFGRPDRTYEREAETCALLQELETAAGRWDLFEAKLLDSKCNRFRAAKALRANILKKPAKRAAPKKKGLWDSDDEAEVEVEA